MLTGGVDIGRRNGVVRAKDGAVDPDHTDGIKVGINHGSDKDADQRCTLCEPGCLQYAIRCFSDTDVFDWRGSFVNAPCHRLGTHPPVHYNGARGVSSGESSEHVRKQTPGYALGESGPTDYSGNRRYSKSFGWAGAGAATKGVRRREVPPEVREWLRRKFFFGVMRIPP